MKAEITATVPTAHQLDQVAVFGLPWKKNLTGSITAYEQFPDKDEAKKHLIRIAERHLVDDELAEALNEIEKYDELTINRVTASISDIEQSIS